MKASIAIALALGAALAAPAQAQQEQAGPYLGASIGGYHYEENGASVQIDDIQMGVYGGYRVNRYLALELAYAHQFEGDDSFSVGYGYNGRIKFKSDVYTATVNPTLPLSDSFSLFAKLGWSYVSADASASFYGYQINASDSSDQFTWGLGAEYRFPDNWSLRAQFDSLDIDNADAWSYSVGIGYHF